MQYSLITLSVAGAALVGLSKTTLPLKVGRVPEKEYLKKSDGGYRALRGTDRSDDIELLVSRRKTISSKDSDDDVLDDAEHKLRMGRINLASIALCVAFRVGVSWVILKAPQCTINNLEVCYPSIPRKVPAHID